MDTLWAPWRLGYIKGEKPAGCIFCDKPREGADEAHYILYRGVHCFVMLNLYPYNNGHLMVIPYEHLDAIDLLKAEAVGELMHLCQISVSIVREELRPTGFNIGINQGAPAGAGVADHVHLHVVPRWTGDTNFMPVLADTRVIAQSLESLYAQLAPRFAQIVE